MNQGNIDTGEGDYKAVANFVIVVSIDLICIMLYMILLASWFPQITVDDTIVFTLCFYYLTVSGSINYWSRDQYNK